MSEHNLAHLVLLATAIFVAISVDAAKIIRSSETAAAVDGVNRHHSHHGLRHRAGGRHHRGVGGRNWENSGVGRGLCGLTGLCCQGKDNNCRATPPDTTTVGKVKATTGGQLTGFNFRSNKTMESVLGQADPVDNRECFCDAACMNLGDCCDDYKQTCQPTDCVLAEEWDEYGECSSRCGPGIKQRRRRVIQPAMNGGKPCGKTVERVHCDGTSCKVARAPNGFEELRETGYIIPAVYGVWRKSKRYDPFSDIRRNLFEHYDAKAVIKRPPYCAVFELTDVHPGCNLTANVAMSNSPAAEADLINWTGQLVKGATVCVECQPAAMKKKLGARCRGHGVLLKETRWDAVTVPGCRGRWVMKSRQEDCQCSANSSGRNDDNLKSATGAAGAEASSLSSFIFV